MDAGTSSGGSTPAPPVSMAGCLELLGGESDSQKRAGLILVTKVFNEIDLSTLLQVYQAVDTEYLLGLLRTGLRKNQGGNGGEKIDADLELSVKILAAYSRVSEIAASPEMIPVVPLLLQILSKGSHPLVIEDCYEFLHFVINAQQDGVRTLFESGGIQLLASQIPSLSDGSPALVYAMELVQLMLSKLPAEEIYGKHPFEIAMLVVGVAQKFGLLHTDLRIKALDFLACILSSKHKKVPVYDALRSMNDSVWSNNMRAGVMAILNSKVGWLIDPVELPEVKNPIPAGRFLQLVFKTLRVEIPVLLNDSAYLRDKASKGFAVSPETVNAKSRSLSLMFSLTESVIKLISKFGDEESHPNAALSNSILKNIKSGLNETISSVLDYLEDAKKHGQGKGEDLRDSVRIIGLYLAETPDACSEKVKKLLSYMITVQGEGDPSPFRCSTYGLLSMLSLKTLSLDGCQLCASSGVYEPVIEFLSSLIGSSSKVEDDNAVYLACYTLCNIMGVRHTLSDNIRAQIEHGLPVKLLGPLSRWAMGTKEDSYVLMVGGICALILDLKSEKTLKLHPDFSRDDLKCVSKLMKKSLAVTSLGSSADSSLSRVIAAAYSHWAHKFPSIRKVVMREVN